MAYTLLDGEKKHADHPTTFHIPDKDAKNTVTLGDHVKLMFEDDEGEIERMWVKVASVESGDNPHLTGTLANDPIVIADLHFGDHVEFTLNHIIDITTQDD